jgi:DNA-binding transcriptional LysR family regulator
VFARKQFPQSVTSGGEVAPMTNIPTDLLRTLVTVVDLRSYTKAAQALGVTQPAVSAQIKRLQTMLSGDLFDRAAPGIALTRQGEAVVGYARRLLAINDEILGASKGDSARKRIRIGLPGDLSGPLLPWTLAKFRSRWPDYNFQTMSGGAPGLLRDMREGNVDIVIALSHEEPVDARHKWSDQLCWVRSDATRVDSQPQVPVPMVAFSEDCMCFRAGTKALRENGRSHRLVMMSGTVLVLSAGVDSGLGTMVMTRGRVRLTQLKRWDDAPLPKLPELHVGIYVREGADTRPLNDLADDLAPLLRPKPEEETDGAFRAVRTAFNKAEALRG